MMSSPSHVVIGSSDLTASADFLALFGFEMVARGVLDAATAARLYGQEVDCTELVVAAPGASRGWLRLIETSGRYTAPPPGDPRSLGVVIETRDLDLSLSQVAQAGVVCHEPVIDALRNVREAVVEGPDDLKVLLRQPTGENARAPRGLLSRQSDRLHSEVAGVIWSAYTFNTIDVYWGQEEGGLEVTDGFVSPDSAPIVQASGLEGRTEPLPYKRVADPLGAPLSLELIEVGEPEWGPSPTWPLAVGIHAIAFVVTSLRLVRPWMRDAAYSKTVEVDTDVHYKSRAVTLRGSGRVRFEIWQEKTPITLRAAVN